MDVIIISVSDMVSQLTTGPVPWDVCESFADDKYTVLVLYQSDIKGMWLTHKVAIGLSSQPAGKATLGEFGDFK